MTLTGYRSFEELHRKECTNNKSLWTRYQQNWQNLHMWEDKPVLLENCFKNFSLKISFKTENTIGKLLNANKHINMNKFNKCGICQLTCPDFNMKYIGLTGRLFRLRFKEHFCDLKYKNGKSKFAQHVVENKQSIVPVEDILEVL